MNMISELRRVVKSNGVALLGPEEFDQLQAEWIKRVGAEELIEQACREQREKDIKAIFPAIDRAMVLCDMVPTRLQNHPDTFVAEIGEAVNGKDGYYHAINDAYEMCKAILSTSSEGK